MKKTYTKKQIQEAIAYWQKQLDENINIDDWDQLDAKKLKTIATRIKGQHVPVVTKVERVADHGRPYEDTHGNGLNYNDVTLIFEVTFDNGRVIIQRFNAVYNKVGILAMCSPEVIGMTEDELNSFIDEVRRECKEEYNNKAARRAERAEYDRLRRKFSKTIKRRQAQ